MASRVGVAACPSVITVFSTGTNSGGGAWIVRPGRRARNWALLR